MTYFAAGSRRRALCLELLDRHRGRLDAQAAMALGRDHDDCHTTPVGVP